MAVTRPRSCSARPDGSRHWPPGWPARPTSRRAPPVRAGAPDLLLDGVALLVTEGYAAGTPALRRALLAVRRQDIVAEEELSWLWLAERAAMAVWDDETWHILASRHVKAARDAGALSELPLAIRSRILLHTHP